MFKPSDDIAFVCFFKKKVSWAKLGAQLWYAFY